MNPLIEVGELDELMRSGAPVVVGDVRWSLATGGDRESYLRGHIPHAQFLHMELDLADPPGDDGRHPLPQPETFAAAMRRCGVNGDTAVVFYDDGPGLSAARAWWLLRYFGHRSAQVLNGGLAAWVAAGLPSTDEVLEAEPGDFTVGAPLMATIDAAHVLAAAENGILLDARDHERFQGVVEPVDPVAGHIPGAVSAPTKGNVGADGRFLPTEDLRRRFEAVGVTADRPTAVYCGSGVTAAHEIVALEVAGSRPRSYPGSWSQWVVDPSRPVATGG